MSISREKLIVLNDFNGLSDLNDELFIAGNIIM